MHDVLTKMGRSLHTNRGNLRLVLYRIICAIATVVVVYVAAQLVSLPHAGWTAASVGLALAVVAAMSVHAAPASFLSWPDPQRSPARTRLTVLVPAAGLIFVIVLLPVLVTTLPPFDAYTNHLARIYVIASGFRDPLLAKYYTIHWRMLPDLGMDLLLPLVVPVTGIYIAGKLLLVFYFFLLFTGPLAIYLALYRKLSLGPLVAGLFVYNYVTTGGFLNYQLGAGVALFGIAAWIALRQASPLLRGVVSLGFVVALFFCHMAALGVYGLTIGSFELWLVCSQSGNRRKLLTDFAVLVLPFVAALALVLLGPVNDGPTIPLVWGGGFASVGGLVHVRLEGILWSVQAYFPRLDFIAFVAMVAGFVWAVRCRMLSIHPFGWVFLGVAMVVYLAIPNTTMGSWGSAARLPFALVFVFIGLLRWEFPSHRAERIFLLAVTVLTVFRVATVERAFWRYDTVRLDFEASMKLVAPGSRILVVTDYTHADDSLRAIWGLPCLAVIERSSMVSLEFSHPMQHPLVVKPPYRSYAGYDGGPVSLSELLHPTNHDVPPFQLNFELAGHVYWADWVHTYDYVYVFDRRDRDALALDRLKPLYAGGHFELFAVRHS
jgi:hypothetical protein